MSTGSICLKILTFILLVTPPTWAGSKMQWHTTHGLEKFPCMNESEIDFFQRWINTEKIEEKGKILSDHRRQVAPGRRSLANQGANSYYNRRYICPPFRGVRNPHPQVMDFGKAATFERIRISPTSMDIVNGLSRNEHWPITYNADKGYFSGKTPRGTPVNLIGLGPKSAEAPRFLVHYLIWQDKTPPSITLCYREDLHKQCNPYKDPAVIKAENAARQPAATADPSKPSS